MTPKTTAKTRKPRTVKVTAIPELPKKERFNTLNIKQESNDNNNINSKYVIIPLSNINTPIKKIDKDIAIPLRPSEKFIKL